MSAHVHRRRFAVLADVDDQQVDLAPRAFGRCLDQVVGHEVPDVRRSPARYGELLEVFASRRVERLASLGGRWTVKLRVGGEDVPVYAAGAIRGAVVEA